MQGLNEMATVQVLHTRELAQGTGLRSRQGRKTEWHPVLLTTLLCSTIGVILSHTYTLGV